MQGAFHSCCTVLAEQSCLHAVAIGRTPASLAPLSCPLLDSLPHHSVQGQPPSGLSSAGPLRLPLGA